jgi:hypothetical protein
LLTALPPGSGRRNTTLAHPTKSRKRSNGGARYLEGHGRAATARGDLPAAAPRAPRTARAAAAGGRSMDVVDRTESSQAAYRRSSLPRGVVAQQEIYLRIVPRTLPPIRPLCPSGGPPARGLGEMMSSRGPDPSSVERESTDVALEGIKRAVDGHEAGRCGSWSGRPASHAHTGCRAPWPRAT